MDLSSALQVVQIVAYLFGAAIFVIMLKADIRVLRHDMNNLTVRQEAMNTSFLQLTEVLRQVAVQDQRIKSIEDDIKELRHGKGYVRDD